MKDLNRLSAVEAAEGIRTKKFTSEELINDCLSHINERENDIQAWSYVNTELAIRQAQKADKHQSEGGSLGALHGIPTVSYTLLTLPTICSV